MSRSGAPIVNPAQYTIGLAPSGRPRINVACTFCGSSWWFATGRKATDASISSAELAEQLFLYLAEHTAKLCVQDTLAPCVETLPLPDDDGNVGPQ